MFSAWASRYHNPEFMDTWDPRLQVTSCVIVESNGQASVVNSRVIPERLAKALREGSVTSIDMFFNSKAD